MFALFVKYGKRFEIVITNARRLAQGGADLHRAFAAFRRNGALRGRLHAVFTAVCAHPQCSLLYCL